MGLNNSGPSLAVEVQFSPSLYTATKPKYITIPVEMLTIVDHLQVVHYNDIKVKYMV